MGGPKGLGFRVGGDWGGIGDWRGWGILKVLGGFEGFRVDILGIY